MKDSYYSKDSVDVVKKLNSNVDKGLSNSIASKRLIENGYNTLPQKKGKGIIEIFFSGFLDPIVLLLVFTVIVSLLIGETVDAFVVMFIIVLDLILGTIEEYQANKNVDSLRNLIKHDVKVLRDGEEIITDSSNLVVGDIVLLESGDNISADMRIIDCANLQVDESVLTGESTGVYKTNEKLDIDTPLVERRNMLYAGCSVITGRAISIVTETGINTMVGHIADTVSKIKEEKSPLTIRMEKLSKQISLLIIIISIIIAIVLYFKGFPSGEVFMSVVALTVSAMPEGLPLALTMALSITSNKMVKKKVIVKKLNYVESLGSCTVIATDKTGTLTVNEQTAKIICLPNNNKYNVNGIGYNNKGEICKLDFDNKQLVEKIVLAGKLNNEAFLNKGRKYVGDSIDIAFLVLAEKAKIYTDEYKIIKRIPYESENKYSAVFYEYKDELFCTVKGSFEVVSTFCNEMNVNNELKRINKGLLSIQNDALSKEGYRVISVATGKVNKFKMKDYYDDRDIPKLTFEGMVGFIDPIRKEVLGAISECHEAGINVLMITGDHPLTAFSIAKELNLATTYDEVVTGNDLVKYIENEKEFDKFIQDKKVFARVTPIEKLKIVESLKRRGEFVAVTGDGVNDAPAIRSANIGVSMGSGTDTAKETASMIIADDNFKSIVSGIELGRCAYSNIRKVCYFLLSCGMAEVLFFLLSIIFDLPMPLVAIQLLWLNLVTDGFQDIALSFEKKEDDIMKRKPINPSESIFNRDMLSEILYSGLFIGIVVFGTWFYLIKKLNMDISLARGYIMVLMVFIQNIHVFNCRSEYNSAFNVPLRNNPLIVLTTFGSILLQIIVMEVPLLSNFLKTSTIPYHHMCVLLALAIIILVAVEIYKGIRNGFQMRD